MIIDAPVTDAFGMWAALAAVVVIAGVFERGTRRKPAERSAEAVARIEARAREIRARREAERKL